MSIDLVHRKGFDPARKTDFLEVDDLHYIKKVSNINSTTNWYDFIRVANFRENPPMPRDEQAIPTENYPEQAYLTADQQKRMKADLLKNVLTKTLSLPALNNETDEAITNDVGERVMHDYRVEDIIRHGSLKLKQLAVEKMQMNMNSNQMKEPVWQYILSALTGKEVFKSATNEKILSELTAPDPALAPQTTVKYSANLNATRKAYADKNAVFREPFRSSYYGDAMGKPLEQISAEAWFRNKYGKEAGMLDKIDLLDNYREFIRLGDLARRGRRREEKTDVERRADEEKRERRREERRVERQKRLDLSRFTKSQWRNPETDQVEQVPAGKKRAPGENSILIDDEDFERKLSEERRHQHLLDLRNLHNMQFRNLTTGHIQKVPDGWFRPPGTTTEIQKGKALLEQEEAEAQKKFEQTESDYATLKDNEWRNPATGDIEQVPLHFKRREGTTDEIVSDLTREEHEEAMNLDQLFEDYNLGDIDEDEDEDEVTETELSEERAAYYQDFEDDEEEDETEQQLALPEDVLEDARIIEKLRQRNLQETSEKYIRDITNINETLWQASADRWRGGIPPWLILTPTKSLDVAEPVDKEQAKRDLKMIENLRDASAIAYEDRYNYVTNMLRAPEFRATAERQNIFESDTFQKKLRRDIAKYLAYDMSLQGLNTKHPGELTKIDQQFAELAEQSYAPKNSAIRGSIMHEFWLPNNEKTTLFYNPVYSNDLMACWTTHEKTSNYGVSVCAIHGVTTAAEKAALAAAKLSETFVDKLTNKYIQKILPTFLMMNNDKMYNRGFTYLVGHSFGATIIGTLLSNFYSDLPGMYPQATLFNPYAKETEKYPWLEKTMAMKNVRTIGMIEDSYAPTAMYKQHHPNSLFFSNPQQNPYYAHRLDNFYDAQLTHKLIYDPKSTAEGSLKILLNPYGEKYLDYSLDYFPEAEMGSPRWFIDEDVMAYSVPKKPWLDKTAKELMDDIATGDRKFFGEEQFQDMAERIEDIENEEALETLAEDTAAFDVGQQRHTITAMEREILPQIQQVAPGVQIDNTTLDNKTFAAKINATNATKPEIRYGDLKPVIRDTHEFIGATIDDRPDDMTENEWINLDRIMREGEEARKESQKLEPDMFDEWGNRRDLDAEREEAREFQDFNEL